MIRTSIQMHENLMEKLSAIAVRQHREQNGIINEAIKEYIEREEHRQKILNETWEGLADIQAGHIIDGEDVFAWLESWGTETELEPPK